VALRPKMRLNSGANFPEDAQTVFLSQSGGIRKVAAALWLQNAMRQAVAQRCGLSGRERFAAWFRTTWLPYTQRVPEDLREEFITGVVDRYIAKHPPDAEGCVQVRMVRLEIDAIKT